MQFIDWRKSQKIRLIEIARLLGVGGSGNPGRHIWRWERGETRPDADHVQRIFILSGGRVTPQDWHETRLGWLKQQGRTETDG